MEIKEEKKNLSRDRKRESRSNESSTVNGVMYVLITKEHAEMTFRKSKKSKATVKMYLPEKVRINGIEFGSKIISEYSDKFMKEVIGEEPIDMNKLNNKQYTRSKEAQINNGILYIMKELGYSFGIKQTKKTKCTERLVKITNITTPYGEIIETKQLEKIGKEFSRYIEEMFGREITIDITNENIPNIGEYYLDYMNSINNKC